MGESDRSEPADNGTVEGRISRRRFNATVAGGAAATAFGSLGVRGAAPAAGSDRGERTGERQRDGRAGRTRGAAWAAHRSVLAQQTDRRLPVSHSASWNQVYPKS